MNSVAGRNEVSRRLIFALPLLVAGFLVLNRPDKPAFTVPEVDLKQAKAMLDAGVLILDVRQPDRYQFRHIAGAIMMPLATLRLGIPASLHDSKTKPILVYCGDGLSMGPEATHILNTAGYAGAVNLRDGIEGWDKAGLPVKRAA